MSGSESFAEAWRARYGAEPSFDFPDLAPLLRHRSVRRFSDRPVPEALMRGLFAAAQSAATSSHLQLWSAVSVHDPETRAEIRRVAADYAHVTEAPWFFVFLADHYRLRKNAATGADALDYAEYFTMAVVDVALAAERLACAAELLGLGICYIGAVRNDPARVAHLLDLPEGAFPAFGLCVGWPDDERLPEIKARLSQEAVWFRDRYDRAVTTAEFDERMRAYYRARGQSEEVTWTMRSARRTDERHLTGREALLDWLREQGFLRR